MQKLEERNTYTPADTPQVCSNCDLALNREETLSVSGLKTSSNNSEVDQLRKEKQDSRIPVYVLNMRGKPLMPTTPRKARLLLKSGKAKVVQRQPFTIQLNYATGETKQPITLGIDPGYGTVGYSAITDKKELISGEVAMRTDIPDKLIEKRQYRRGRRNKLWYRAPRFDNRVRKEVLQPSAKHKLESHLRLIDRIKGLLPTTTVIIEVSSFDTQKMVNPEISGIEYQQGELQGYEIREYLLEKFNRTCVYCGKTDVPLQIEHIIPSSRKGSDRVSNLTISCHKCNQKKGNKTAEEFGHSEVQELAKKPLKTTAFMNQIRWKLVETLGCNHTFGSITKCNRIKLGLEKSHANDAFVIAGGTAQIRIEPHLSKQVKRNNRTLQINRKGFKPSIRRRRYPIQPNDLVLFKVKSLVCTVKGVFNYGKSIRLADPSGLVINTNIKNMEIIKYGKGLQL
ncbi:MAG: RNA-guided endonuclease IscB (plasmid) [Candidatus Methanoperedens sp.]|nr:MAG: RNA-guided endonuclease IscB [Candidatus Methanoperedens sp.]